LLLFLVTLLVSSTTASSLAIDRISETEVVVRKLNGEQLVHGVLEKQTVSTGGWNLLTIVSHQANDDKGDHVDYHRAAGIAESLLTCEITYQFYLNSYYGSFGDTGKPNEELKNFMMDNYAWMKKQSLDNDDEYWIAVRQTIAQFEGLIEGYEKSECAAKHPLSLFDWLILNAYGDLIDLLSKFDLEETSPRHQEKSEAGPLFKQRCSSFVKPVDNLTDLYFGHTTWDTYATTFPRVYKTIRLPVLQNGDWVMHQTAFSSSPGLIASLDDWYVLSKTSDLIVMETTLNVYNLSLYEYVIPQSVPCWIRVVVANKLAVDGKSWTELFGKYHSGTYNNEWLIIDQSKLHHDQPGLFYLLDELPGTIISEDVTELMIKKGYWASYNIPYFPEVFEKSGYAALAKTSDLYSYSKAPRANIFRARHDLVQNLDSMEGLMQYNDWQNDPMSLGSASLSIAARGDLNTRPSFAGAIDSKLSSIRHLHSNQKSVFARVGQTHETQPVFCWSHYPNATTTHAGHPDCFPFEFVPIKIL
jgi:hypothetical protein